MASRISETAKLQIKVQTGISESGKAVIRTRSIGNIDPDLSDDNALSAAVKLGSLQTYDVKTISLVNTAVLGE